MKGGSVVDDREETMLNIVGVVAEEQVKPEGVIEVGHGWYSAWPGNLGRGVGIANLALHGARCLENGGIAASKPEMSHQIFGEDGRGFDEADEVPQQRTWGCFLRT